MYKKIVVIADKFGSRDFAVATKIVEVAMPSRIPAGHVAIRVAATGIEASDIIQMGGGYGPLAQKPPATVHDGTVQVGDLGCEGVGVITAAGDGVDSARYPVGQAVCFFGFGVSFREHVVLPADGASLVPVPTPDAVWTAMPVSALTAVGGLELHGGITSGQTVLVTGAAGGTGHIAVQWAKLRGCRVAGTCGSGEKGAMLADLGCDVIVNYKTQDVAAVLAAAFPGGFDIVYDGVGGRIGDIGKALLGPNGKFVGIGNVSQDYTGATIGDSGEGAPPEKKPGQTISFFFMPNGSQSPRWPGIVAEVVDAIVQKKIRIVMDSGCQSFVGLDGVYKAQARMRQGDNAGKIYATFS